MRSLLEFPKTSQGEFWKFQRFWGFVRVLSGFTLSTCLYDKSIENVKAYRKISGKNHKI